jgi:opacity protein-like surface antigen
VALTAFALSVFLGVTSCAWEVKPGKFLRHQSFSRTNAGNHCRGLGVLGFSINGHLLEVSVRQRSGFSIFMFLAILAGAAAAQEENPIPGNNELSGVLGRSFISDQAVASSGEDVHFGRGLSFEIGYGWRFRENPVYSITAEVPVLVNPDEKLNYFLNVTPESYKSIFVTPSVRVAFMPRTHFSPWGSFGVGFGHFSASSNLEFGGGPNPGKTGSTGAVLQFGGGLDVRITHSLGLRTEIREYWSGVPQLNVDTGKSRQSNIFVGSGVIWHF